MHVFYDVIDWVGGYPYEFPTFNEVKEFVEGLGFELLKSPTRIEYENKGLKRIQFLKQIMPWYTGCNEFVFKRIK